MPGQIAAAASLPGQAAVLPSGSDSAPLGTAATPTPMPFSQLIAALAASGTTAGSASAPEQTAPACRGCPGSVASRKSGFGHGTGAPGEIIGTIIADRPGAQDRELENRQPGYGYRTPGIIIHPGTHRRSATTSLIRKYTGRSRPSAARPRYRRRNRSGSGPGRQARSHPARSPAPDDARSRSGGRHGSLSAARGRAGHATDLDAAASSGAAGASRHAANDPGAPNSGQRRDRPRTRRSGCSGAAIARPFIRWHAASDDPARSAGTRCRANPRATVCQRTAADRNQRAAAGDTRPHAARPAELAAHARPGGRTRRGAACSISARSRGPGRCGRQYWRARPWHAGCFHHRRTGR